MSRGNWLDAKWSLLFSSTHLLDKLRAGVRGGGRRALMAGAEGALIENVKKVKL